MQMVGVLGHCPLKILLLWLGAKEYKLITKATYRRRFSSEGKVPPFMTIYQANVRSIPMIRQTRPAIPQFGILATHLNSADCGEEVLEKS